MGYRNTYINRRLLLLLHFVYGQCSKAVSVFVLILIDLFANNSTVSQQNKKIKKIHLYIYDRIGYDR